MTARLSFNTASEPGFRGSLTNASASWEQSDFDYCIAWLGRPLLWMENLKQLTMRAPNVMHDSRRFAFDDRHPCWRQGLDRPRQPEARGLVKRAIFRFSPLAAARADYHVEIGKKWV
jgi:hypothetical protein